MWICLRVPKNVTRKGKIHRYQAGEWLQVGRQIAETWISAREAFSTDEILTEVPSESAGLVIRNSQTVTFALASEIVQKLKLESHITEDWETLRYAEMCIWKPGANLRPDLVAVGFELLKKWHIAVPLCPEGVLAINTGPDAEREKTTAIIGDGRVPLRDTRLIFVRRCAPIRAMWDQMHAEIAQGADERHAFLRALYQHKPLVCDLPPVWV